jgi:hypothetical protein
MLTNRTVRVWVLLIAVVIAVLTMAVIHFSTAG